MKRLLMLLATLVALTGCGNAKLNSALEAAQVASESAQATFHMLAAAATAMIPALPADQQAAARDDLASIVLKGDQLFAAEADAIRTAILANAATFDASAFAAQVATVIEDLIRFATRVGVRNDITAHATARVAALRAK
jgi:hypothetical protein